MALRTSPVRLVGPAFFQCAGSLHELGRQRIEPLVRAILRGIVAKEEGTYTSA